MRYYHYMTRLKALRGLKHRLVLMLILLADWAKNTKSHLSFQQECGGVAISITQVPVPATC